MMKKEPMFKTEVILTIVGVVLGCLILLANLISYGLQESDEIAEYVWFNEKDFYESEFEAKFISERDQRNRSMIFFTIDTLHYRADYYSYINLKDHLILKGMNPDQIYINRRPFLTTNGPGVFTYRIHNYASKNLVKSKSIIKKKNTHYILVDTVPIFLFKSSIDSTTVGAIKAPDVFKKVIEKSKDPD